MFHWFDEAQFDEAGNFIYTYMGLGDYIASISMMVFALIILFRLVLAFRHYIYTGKYGDVEKSGLIGMFDNNFKFRWLFIGYHPGGIAADTMIFILAAVSAVFFWAVIIVGGLFILLATTMRKRIAHKQEFIGNLRGDQLDG